jgi:hypothetical protein
MVSEDFSQERQTFMEKRKPEFKDRSAVPRMLRSAPSA